MTRIKGVTGEFIHDVDGLAPVEPDYEACMDDFGEFCLANGIRKSELTEALTNNVDINGVNTSLSCVALSTPPQEGKTTWIVHFIAWQLYRNPWLNVVYATYSQGRANAVSRQIRSIVKQWTPLKTGSSNVQRWETEQGGGLLAAGRGSAMTGFSSDLTVIDDPIKDMQEAQSETIREQTQEWFSSVVLTRMSSLSQILVVATRWHRDDLIAHVVKNLNAHYINIPAQSVDKNDPLGRKPGEWLNSVQNRSAKSWELIKAAVGTYVWQALYQGDPQVTGGSYIDVDKIDVIPWDTVVYQDDRGFMQTLGRAVVIQSWDLTFGSVTKRGRNSTSGDYVAGHVYALIGQKWILIDRVHARLTFTETVTRILQLSARWPQTSRIYVEKAANGAAVIDMLKRRAALIKPVVPQGSKEARALAIQPVVDAGNVAVVDTVYDDAMFQEFRDFPFGKHDDDVDAMTQAITNGRQDYLMIRK